MRQTRILPYQLNLEICQVMDQWRSAVKDGRTYLSFGEFASSSYNAVCMDHWQREVSEWAALDTPVADAPGTYSEWLNVVAGDSFC